MQWLMDLFTVNSIAQTVILLCLAVFPGILLGGISVKGVKIGIAGVLFSGLFMGALGLPVDGHVLHFIREFGLILFVFSIGLQVGPSFFANFKRDGLTLNFYAALIVILGVIVAMVEMKLFNLPVEVMVGVLSGAVTNTPGLGAAQQSLLDAPGVLESAGAISGAAYAVAYPFGIFGIILTMLLIRFFFKIKIDQEAENHENNIKGSRKSLQTFSAEVKNPQIDGKTIAELNALLDHQLVVTRHLRSDGIELAAENNPIKVGDVLHVVTNKKGLEKILAMVGSVTDADLRKTPSKITVWRILVTQANGHTLQQERYQERMGVRITRVLRAGLEILPEPTMRLQVGDHVTVVGQIDDLKKLSKELGDSKARLYHPNMLPIFIGILLGVLLGSIPLPIPGLPAPVKLGLAGGPLVIALLMGIKGRVGPLHFYMPVAVGTFMREFGILLFLAAVGLNSGESFVKYLREGTGWVWMGAGVAITFLPIFVVGMIARIRGLNYLSLAGLLSGSMTDPPALGYANSLSSSQAQATAYASVYPLTMFLRIMTAQIFVMLML